MTLCQIKKGSYAHEMVESPIGFGIWVCSCEKCDLSIRATLLTYPDLAIVGKGTVGRFSLPAEMYLERKERWIAEIHAREVFVKMNTGAPLCQCQRAGDCRVYGRGKNEQDPAHRSDPGGPR